MLLNFEYCNDFDLITVSKRRKDRAVFLELYVDGGQP